MRVFLIRHAQTAWNREGRAQGHSDIPLDDVGLRQSQLLGERFKGAKLDAILSSDLERCIQTATPIADSTGVVVERLPELRERSFGEWEGMLFEEFQSKLWANSDLKDPFSHVVPGGESFRMVWNRLEPIAARLSRSEGNIVVVTHGGSCSLLLARLLRGSIETSRAFRFSNTGVSELAKRPEGLFRLDVYNDTSHLSADALTGDLDGSHR